MFSIKSITVFVAFHIAVAASQEVDVAPCPPTGLSYLPHYGDCTLFFECLNGNKVLLRCPNDYAWSIPRDQCVIRSEADCSYTTIAPPDGQTCPATGISYLPHYSDCTKFFECLNGNKQIMDCPDEYAWSITQNKCVVQAEADCSYTTIAPADTCPAQGISYLPVYSNCRQYIRCDEGLRTIETCPSGYAWSIIIQACDLEDLVDCSYTDCPAEGLVYYPVYTDCTQYMKCNFGEKSIQTCPDGYAWSILIQACDLKALVDCSGVYNEEIVSSRLGIDRPFPTSARPTTPTTKPTTTTKKPDGVCYGKPEGTFLPHPTDCHKFIECTHNEAAIIDCPSGTSWDQNILTCDYNEAENCK